eukprot:1182198-Rhodomonas_salina.1
MRHMTQRRTAESQPRRTTHRQPPHSLITASPTSSPDRRTTELCNGTQRTNSTSAQLSSTHHLKPQHRLNHPHQGIKAAKDLHHALRAGLHSATYGQRHQRTFGQTRDARHGTHDT